MKYTIGFIVSVFLLSCASQYAGREATSDDKLIVNERDYCQTNPNSPECVNCYISTDHPVCNQTELSGVGHISDAFSQVTGRNKLDIIWVVDNSESMLDKQTAINENFLAFINLITSRGIDFKIGITTTDTSGEGSTLNHNGEFQGTNPVLSSTSMTINELQENFEENIMVGINGSGRERGLEAASRAVEKNSDPSSVNFNFLRDDAFLAIIIVSDENDISPNSTKSYLDLIIGIKDDPKDVAIYSIVDIFTPSYDDPFSEPINLDTYLENGDFNPGGGRYIEAATYTGGNSMHVYDNFTNSLVEISSKIVELVNIYELRSDPIVSTIRIRLNGVEIYNDENNGWIYKEEINSIIFKGDSIPPTNSVVEIIYKHIDSLDY